MPAAPRAHILPPFLFRFLPQPYSPAAPVLSLLSASHPPSAPVLFLLPSASHPLAAPVLFLPSASHPPAAPVLFLLSASHPLAAPVLSLLPSASHPPAASVLFLLPAPPMDLQSPEVHRPTSHFSPYPPKTFSRTAIHSSRGSGFQAPPVLILYLSRTHSDR